MVMQLYSSHLGHFILQHFRIRAFSVLFYFIFSGCNTELKVTGSANFGMNGNYYLTTERCVKAKTRPVYKHEFGNSYIYTTGDADDKGWRLHLNIDGLAGQKQKKLIIRNPGGLPEEDSGYFESYIGTSMYKSKVFYLGSFISPSFFLRCNSPASKLEKKSPSITDTLYLP